MLTWKPKRSPVGKLLARYNRDRRRQYMADPLSPAPVEPDPDLRGLLDADHSDPATQGAYADLLEERGLPGNPMRAYLESGHQEQIEADRVGGTQAGWS